jgi:hypothetical protein
MYAKSPSSMSARTPNRALAMVPWPAGRGRITHARVGQCARHARGPAHPSLPVCKAVSKAAVVRRTSFAHSVPTASATCSHGPCQRPQEVQMLGGGEGWQDLRVEGGKIQDGVDHARAAPQRALDERSRRRYAGVVNPTPQRGAHLDRAPSTSCGYLRRNQALSAPAPGTAPILLSANQGPGAATIASRAAQDSTGIGTAKRDPSAARAPTVHQLNEGRRIRQGLAAGQVMKVGHREVVEGHRQIGRAHV